MNRFLCVPLALALTLSLSAPAGAAEADASYSDTSGHWAEAAVGRWSAKGVIQGDHGAFRPDDPLTRGELAAILDRVMGYRETGENTFSDLGENWYTNSILHLSAAGIMEGSGGRVRPGDPLSRPETAVLLARAFQVEDGQAPLPFSDKADVADWALGAVSALTAAGQLQGCSGVFDPEGDVTRASLVTMLDNMVSDLVTQAGDYSRDAESSLVVAADKAVLKDMEVKGDLIIADAVGDGDVTLENVRVDGRLIIRGGGEHSIHIAGDASRYGTVIVTKTASGKVRLVNESGAPIPMVNVADGRDGVTLEGDFTGVVVASDVAVVAASGSIESLTVAVENAQVTLGGDAKVEKLDVPKDTAGATLTVEKGASVGTLTLGGAATVQNSGTIKKAEVAASDVVLGGQKPSTVFVEKGVEQPKDDKGNEIKDSSSSGGGGGGGGPSSPSVTPINSVNIKLSVPKALKPASNAVATGTGYIVAETAWSPSLNDNRFALDTDYTATVTIEPANSSYQFSSPSISITNGELAQTTVENSKITLSVSFPKTASSIEIEIIQSPDSEYSTDTQSSIGVRCDAHTLVNGIEDLSYIIYYQWYQCDDIEKSGAAPVKWQWGNCPGVTLSAEIPGTYYFFCRLSTDGLQLDSPVITLTVTEYEEPEPTPPIDYGPLATFADYTVKAIPISYGSCLNISWTLDSRSSNVSQVNIDLCDSNEQVLLSTSSGGANYQLYQGDLDFCAGFPPFGSFFNCVYDLPTKTLSISCIDDVESVHLSITGMDGETTGNEMVIPCNIHFSSQETSFADDLLAYFNPENNTLGVNGLTDASEYWFYLYAYQYPAKNDMWLMDNIVSSSKNIVIDSATAAKVEKYQSKAYVVLLSPSCVQTAEHEFQINLDYQCLPLSIWSPDT